MSASARGREDAIVGTEADEVVTLLIVEHPAHGAAEVVPVVKEEAARLGREEVEARLRVEVFAAAPVHLLYDLLRRHPRSAVGGGQSEIGQAARVERVEDDRRAVGLIDESAQLIQHARAAAGVVPVKYLEAAGEEHDRLAARQLAHPAHDEVERAERADRVHLRAEVFEVGRRVVSAAAVVLPRA